MAIEESTLYGLTGSQLEDLASRVNDNAAGLVTEAYDRAEEDSRLQTQIDAIAVSSEVTDVVGTKAALNAYDISTLRDNDIIKVLQDESENGATTYYRWSTATSSFTLIGEEGPYYTKAATNALLDEKVDKETGKGLSTNDFTDADKTKLNGIEAGAEENTIDSISVNGVAQTPDANKNIDLTISGGIKTLTTADYNYPTDNPVRIALWTLDPGFYRTGERVLVAFSSNPSVTSTLAKDTTILILQSALSDGTFGGGFKTILHVPSSASYAGMECHYVDGTGRAYHRSAFGVPTDNFLRDSDVKNNLTTTANYAPLSATQGKILNEKIEGRIIQNAGAPTTSTVGTVGLLLEDTTNGTLYQCTAVDATSSPTTYTWVKYATGSGGPNVVQTTGTSTTDVMSQNAVTGMIFADPSTQHKICIKGTVAENSSAPICLGEGAATLNGNFQVALQGRATGMYAQAYGCSANANGVGTVALGACSSATRQGEVAIGSTNTSCGYNSSNYRLLTGLYDPQSDHDAATKGYVDAAVASAGADAFTTSEWDALWA